MDYFQSQEVHTSTLVTQIEALQRDVSTLQRQHIDDEDRRTRHLQHEHTQRDVAPEDGDTKASRVRNGYGSNGSRPRLAQAVRECTYPDFLKCKPLNFKGTEGALPWKTLKKMMIDKYCPRGEIKKLKTEMWELKTKGTDVIGYSRRFQELALMCDRTFLEESDRVEKYIGGVPNMIHDSVKATKPKTMQEAIEFSTEMMDKRICDAAENKQKFKGTVEGDLQMPTITTTPTTTKTITTTPTTTTATTTTIIRRATGGNDNTQARVYVVGNAGANPDNVIAGTKSLLFVEKEATKGMNLD
nr:reverse transcriptase domain-containing protein [Tanacetum cinerariifolium]